MKSTKETLKEIQEDRFIINRVLPIENETNKQTLYLIEFKQEDAY